MSFPTFRNEADTDTPYSIVRYHTAWTEETQLPFTSEFEGSSQPTETRSSRLTVETSDATSDESASEEASDFDEDDEDDDGPPGEFDMDLGLDDLDSVDFLSVGHSKSRDYPSIHFGNEEDPSTNGQNSPVLSRPATRTSSPAVAPSPKHSRTLYIQVRRQREMETCSADVSCLDGVRGKVDSA